MKRQNQEPFLMNKMADVASELDVDMDIDMDEPTPIRPAAAHFGPESVIGDGVGEIVYSRTKVSPVSRDVLAGNRVVTALEPGAVSDAYKILAIQVVQRLRERGRNSVAVVSPREGEGKTLTAVNLAISLAAEVDHTVLLVDADLRSPAVHRCFGFVPEFGLSDHLLSNVPVERILVNPGIKSLVVLLGGRPIANSAEMLGSLKMQRLVQDLKARYASRLIVFDLPPVLAAADMLAFAPFVDAAVMVVEESGTSRDDILRAAHMLSSVELIGTVLNKSTVLQTTGYAPMKKPGNFFTRLFRDD
jgi:capsular exopolysaccharide synthesis family protein